MGAHRTDVSIDAANIGVTRHDDTAEALLDAVRDTRVWGGLHHRFSVDAGVRLAERVVDHNLRRDVSPAR